MQRLAAKLSFAPQDSDKRARAAATAVDGASVGRKSEAAAAAADSEVS